MRLLTILLRTLGYHWRGNLAVVLGVMVGTATLTGALLVGDSMRASLRDAALGRLGNVQHALVANRFFRAELAAELAESPEFQSEFTAAAAVVLLRGSVTHAETGARVDRANILGVDEQFWELGKTTLPTAGAVAAGATVVLNERVAAELGAKVGDDVLVRFGKPSAVSTETLLGRRDDTTVALRLSVERIIASQDLGAFTLNPRQFLPHNAYVPLATLQRRLDRGGRANAILVAADAPDETQSVGGADRLQQIAERQFTLRDFGLRLRVDEPQGYVALESESFLLEPAVESAAIEAARELDLTGEPVLAYLANEIALDAGDRERTPRTGIPYSIVAALDPRGATASAFAYVAPPTRPAWKTNGIVLNEWAAADLGARLGDRVRLTYYLTGPFGQLLTRFESFELIGIVRLSGAAADPRFTPEYPGVTDAESVSDWDPPFPLDLSKVRDKDEAYWSKHHATPKAFVTLEDGLRLWAHDAERVGRLTALRFHPASGANLLEAAEELRAALLAKLDPRRLGLGFEPVREQAEKAASGSTDFGGLFIGFSFFLIGSAAMLVALLFRLNVERRSHEIGILLATGFSRRTVLWLLLLEGALLADLGAVLGLAGAAGYAWLMLAGLRTWWAAAVRAPFLQLHISATSLAIGYCAGIGVALIAIAWSLRGLTRMPARALLAGVLPGGAVGMGAPRRPIARTVGIVAFALGALLAVLSFTSEALPQTAAFFGSGSLMLIACIALCKHALNNPRRAALLKPGGAALARLGARNAPRHPGRSTLTIGLVASATFLIASLDAFHLQSDADNRGKDSGTGGFDLVAESAVPLAYDLDTAAGRAALDFAEPDDPKLAATSIIPFRLRPGDESSCLNLYVPTKPRILGASPRMIQRGGFRFSSKTVRPDAVTEPGTVAEPPGNPWKLLDGEFADGAIPVIGDEAAVKWQLHLDVGKDLEIEDGRGRNVRLRFVALLQGSALQDELIVAESNFRRLFPTLDGHAFFLISTPKGSSDDVSGTLERELSRFGFDARRTADRLDEYLAVQNTYLSTFQTLGGLGLVLGAIGLAAVLLRNVWERRSELALMRAVGFSRGGLGWMVLAENVLLVGAGLLAGLIPALVAVAPHLAQRPGTLPWATLALTLLGVFATGIGGGAVALIPVLRAPLLKALRAE
ncbi:MAG: FtsX-like permease family protein [Planctomycetes bacterium]|nr:FtsX-like permease family protein [Planctomycetota bacterium]